MRNAEITWTVYGKIKAVTRYTSPTHQLSDLEFAYDASGNRIMKLEKTRDVGGSITSSSEWNYTYYLRDASGNIMSTYAVNNGVITWNEAHIYGSSRIGLVKQDKILNNDACAVVFDATYLYMEDPNSTPYEDLLDDYLVDAGLSEVSATVYTDFKNAIVQAKMGASDQAHFEDWLSGLQDYLCLFKCYYTLNPQVSVEKKVEKSVK